MSLTDDAILEDDFDAEDDEAVMDFMVSTMKALREQSEKDQREYGISMFSSHNQKADFMAEALRRLAAESEDE